MLNNIIHIKRTNKNKIMATIVIAAFSVCLLFVWGNIATQAAQPPATQTTITLVQDGTPIDAGGNYDAPNDNSASTTPGLDPGPTNGYVKNLDVVTYEVEVTQNDAPGTNITSTIVLDDNSRWDAIPSSCLTDAGLVPLTELQDNNGDGLDETLVCNLGDHDEGTKLIFDVQAVAVGEHQDTFFAAACSDADENMNRGLGYAAGECDDASPVEITAGFGVVLTKLDRVATDSRNAITGPGGTTLGSYIEWDLEVSYIPGSEIASTTDYLIRDTFDWEDSGGVSVGGMNTVNFHPNTLNSNPVYTNYECRIETSHTVYSSVACTQPGGPGTPVEIDVQGVDSSVTDENGVIFTVQMTLYGDNNDFIPTCVSDTFGMNNTAEIVDANGSTEVTSISGLINTASNEIDSNQHGVLFTCPGSWTVRKTFTGTGSTKQYDTIRGAVGDVIPTIIMMGDDRDITTRSAVCEVIDTASFEFVDITPALTSGTPDGNYPNGLTTHTGVVEGLFENHNPTLTLFKNGVPSSFDLHPGVGNGVTIEYSDTAASPDHWEGNCTTAGNNWVTDYTTLPGGASSVTKVRMIWDRTQAGVDALYGGTGTDVDSNLWFAINLRIVSTEPVGTKLPNTATSAPNLHIDDINNLSSWSYNAIGSEGVTSFIVSQNPADALYSWGFIGDFVTLVGNQHGVEKTAQVSTFAAGDDVLWDINVTTTNGGDNNPATLTLVDTIPDGLTYASDNCAAVITGCTSGVAGQVVTLTIPNHVYGDPLATIELTTSSTDFTAPGDYTNEVTISSTSTATPIPTVTGDMSISSDTVSRIGAGGIFVQKATEQSVREINGQIGYELTYSNTGPSDRDEGIIIDVLPFIGDDEDFTFRDPNSDFSGTVNYVSIAGTNGETYEFTRDTPSAIHHEPCHPDNWNNGEGLGGGNALLDTVCEEGLLNASGDPDPTATGTGLTNWQPGPIPTDDTVTAIRVITTPMSENSPPRTLELVLQTADNAEGDRYCNNFSGQFGQRLDETSNDVCIIVAVGSIGDYVWLDINGDGVQDANEVPLSGVDVKLLVEDPASPGTYIPYQIDDPTNPGNLVDYIVTTDSNGLYLFDNLPSGNYQVMIDDSTLPGGLVPTWDNDNQTAQDGSQDNMSAVTIYGPDTPDTANGFTGADYTDVDDDTAQDFGYIGQGSIGDTVWIDIDGDGVEDADEDQIAGVTVKVTYLGADGVAGGGDDILYTAVTGDNPATTEVEEGWYYVDGLPFGEYSVMVDTSTFPAGLVQTFDNDGLYQNDSMSMATLSSTSPQDLDQDFGYAPPAELSGRVWFDNDEAGDLDDDEGFVAGVMVELLDVDGNVIATTETDEDGFYQFTDLAPGEYQVRIASLDGYSQTYDNDGEGDYTIQSITLSAGDSVIEQDFGLAETGVPVAVATIGAVLISSLGLYTSRATRSVVRFK